MIKKIKLCKYISIVAIASIMVNKIIRMVFGIELFSSKLDIIPLVTALIFYTIYWQNRPKSETDIF